MIGSLDNNHVQQNVGRLDAASYFKNTQTQFNRSPTQLGLGLKITLNAR